jgi:hypothetical protein
LARFQFCRRVSKITRCDDVVTIEHASRFVSGDGDGNALADAAAVILKNSQIRDEAADALRIMPAQRTDPGRLAENSPWTS